MFGHASLPASNFTATKSYEHAALNRCAFLIAAATRARKIVGGISQPKNPNATIKPLGNDKLPKSILGDFSSGRGLGGKMRMTPAFAQCAGGGGTAHHE
jgi:hypothetical protein